VGLGGEAVVLGAGGDELADEGVSTRVERIRKLLFEATKDHPKREEIGERLASHPSDTVRMWVAYMPLADTTLSLSQHLDAARRFAADSSMNVKESAWDAIRPYVLENLSKGLKKFEPWVYDSDPNIRRCAVEGMRPCGVWTKHCQEFKDDPEPGLNLLEPVRSDPSCYVHTATAD
jgi:hypothetical protein